MPKLFWVALPLLAALALLAARALSGRPPSRRSVNVWSSLLLLAYVLSTAGLGVFWVANQQLPVFDWHYLYGYATVLLVALHLAFNLPAAWRHVARPRGAGAARRAPAPAGRRAALAALGAAAAAGFAFLLGLRHGRSELRVEVPPAGGAAPGAGAAGLSFVEGFHAHSSHTRAGVLLRAPGTEWRDPPPAFKRHPGAPRVALPAPGAAAGAAFDLAALGAALWHTVGVTQRRGPLALRASPSSGALFSTELYVAARAVPGLAAGLWHHDAGTHALERLAAGPVGAAALGAPGDPGLEGAAAVVVATAVFGRTGHKYRDRTYRYVLADLGHALENLRVAAAALGARAELLAAFDESLVAAALGVDEAVEGVLAVVALHAGPAAAPRLPAAVPSRWRPAPLPAAASGAAGVTAAVHLATSLRLAAPAPAPPAAVVAPAAAVRLPEVAPMAPAASSPAARPGEAQGGAVPPSPGVPPARVGADAAVPAGPAADTVGAAGAAGTARAAALAPASDAAPRAALALIAARRSVRRYADRPLALGDLAGVLAAMTSGRGGAVLSDAVRVDVVAHAVAGLAPGAYRHDAAAGALLPRRVPARLRDAARAAALDQDVIGDAAAVLVLSIDRAAFAADPLGPARGYRHAYVEAGLVGERVYLEAQARGLGACAVGAFHDDEAAALVGIDPAREWVVHFAALGIPAG